MTLAWSRHSKHAGGYFYTARYRFDRLTVQADMAGLWHWSIRRDEKTVAMGFARTANDAKLRAVAWIFGEAK